MLMKQSYSVLKMSKRQPADRTAHTYEHSIVIGKCHGNTQEEIFHKLAQKLREETYLNAFGESVQWEVVTWAKFGLHQKPSGLLNTDGFYDGLIQFLTTMEENGFLLAKERSQLIIENTSERLIARMKEEIV